MGWTECIKLPIKVFFEFYNHGIKMEAAQYREELYIAMIPSMKFECFQRQEQKYNSLISPKVKMLPPRPTSMHIEAGSDDARDVLMGVMRSLKRGMGYGS